MPDFGIFNFNEIKANLERIKKEENINGVDTSDPNRANNQSTGVPTGAADGYPSTTSGPEPIYMGCSNAPAMTEAFKRYQDNPVTGLACNESEDNMLKAGESWRDYLLSPISGTFSLGWGKLYSIG